MGCPFGTFFVRVCNVAALFFRVYRYGLIGDQNVAAAAIGRIIIFGALDYSYALHGF